MKVTDVEYGMNGTIFKDLNEGDIFLNYESYAWKQSLYIKTEVCASSIENGWAIDLYTGKFEKFNGSAIVFPVEMTAQIRPKTAELTCEGCKYYNMASYDNSGPCPKCSRDYPDKYEKKREEG